MGSGTSLNVHSKLSVLELVKLESRFDERKKMSFGGHGMELKHFFQNHLELCKVKFCG